MIKFTYNGVTYEVASHAKIKDRLLQGEIKALPLAGWKVLFEATNGAADIEDLRAVLIAKINIFDIEDVNEFNYKGEKTWWDKNTRVGLMNLTNCSDKTILIIINDKIIEFDKEDLKNLLFLLEVYANKCFVQTYKHIEKAKNLQTIEDIINYDYTLGYPDKVVIE